MQRYPSLSIIASLSAGPWSWVLSFMSNEIALVLLPEGNERN